MLAAVDSESCRIALARLAKDPWEPEVRNQATPAGKLTKMYEVGSRGPSGTVGSLNGGGMVEAIRPPYENPYFLDIA